MTDIKKPKLKVLVVDDEKGIVDIFRNLLEVEGCEVLGVYKGQDAVAVMQDKNPDIVFLDIRLPDIEGTEVIDWIKGVDKNVLVVMMTAYATMETAIISVQKGAFDYLVKPLDLEKILDVLRRGIDQIKTNRSEKKAFEDSKQQMVVLEQRLKISHGKLTDAYQEIINRYKKAVGGPSLWGRLKEWYLSHITWLVVPSLVAGVLAAKFSSRVLNIALPIVDGFIEGLLILAPVAIFLILAPTVAKLLKTRGESKFAGYVVVWFTLSRVLACVVASLFVWLALDLPLFPEAASEGAGSSSFGNYGNLVKTLAKNIFIQATVIAILVGFVAYFYQRLYNLLNRGAQMIESLGEYIEPIIPIFMFLLGAFIFGLPTALAKELDPSTLEMLGTQMTLFGMPINLRGEYGLMWVYAVETLLIIMVCFLWSGSSSTTKTDRLLVGTYFGTIFFFLRILFKFGSKIGRSYGL